MVLGVGWQDCQSSPTRTLHPWLNPKWKKHSRRHSPLHDCAKGSLTSHSRPSYCCSSTDKNGAAFPHAGPPQSVPSSRSAHIHAQVFFCFGAHTASWELCVLHPRFSLRRAIRVVSRVYVSPYQFMACTYVSSAQL